MPELTVSMPARNTALFVGQAIESVLAQEGVDFELIVVDDASEDGTAAIVRSFADPRLRLIRNERRMGIAHCHNRVIAESGAPFIAHVDSDDLILPGALPKMLDKLKSSPRIGLAHCHFFAVDEEGRTTREAFRAGRSSFLRNRRPGMDYRRELLVTGSVMNHLRTYRREAFDTVGRFNEELPWGEDHEMALRIADRYEIGLVPEFLYCRRLHRGNTWDALRFKGLRSWRRRFLNARRLLKSGQAHFLRQEAYSLNRLMARGLCRVMRLPEILPAVRRAATLPGRALRAVAGRIAVPLQQRFYALAVYHLSWWPLDLVRRKLPAGSVARKRVGYYLWHFPTLSQTFVQREVAALLDAEMDVQVFTDASEDLELLDETARSLLKITHYLYPEDENLFLRYRSHFRSRHFLLYLNLFLYVVFHRHSRYKTLDEDFLVFRKAIYLAGLLEDAGVGLIHAPWADKCAFVALVASRLAGISCSVQARAHDLHRKTHSYALREKFENSEFVISNSRYNEAYILSLLKEPFRGSVHTIYEGLDLARFQPVPRDQALSGPFRILSVARLIEQKGLDYLLRACGLLRDWGYPFRCEIIGGPELPVYAAYCVNLKKLHRKLALEDCVFFLGAQPFHRVLEAYARSDAFVLPCVEPSDGGQDVTPNSLIEAMAMKLPAVCTVLSAIPEIVDDGANGILVPPGDVQALAQAMKRLMLDGALRRELGENARRKVEERFDINRNIREYVALFKGCRQGREPSG